MNGRDAVAGHVPRGTLLKLDAFAERLTAENQRQNLIARSTEADLWSRHILDSLQLLELAPPTGLWIDIGSGGGLPGFVIALASDRPVLMVEPRAKRAAFLQTLVGEFGLDDRVRVAPCRVDALPPQQAAVISARAVSSLPQLLKMSTHLAAKDTLWLLPKGKSAKVEVEAARESWHGRFDLIPSRTEDESLIVMVRDARPRGKL